MSGVQQDVTGLVGAGVGLGVGALTVGAIEGKTGHDYGLTSGFGAAGRMMGPLATGMMGMRTLQAVQQMQPKKRRRRRK